MRQLQCDIPAPTKAMLPLDSVTGSVIRTLTASVTLAAVDLDSNASAFDSNAFAFDSDAEHLHLLRLLHLHLNAPCRI